MTAVQRLATLGRAARESVRSPVRQPLAELVAVIPYAGSGATGTVARLVRELEPVLMSELNVKRVRWAETGDALVTLEAKANFRQLGKRFGKSTPLAAKGAEALSSDALHRFEHGDAVAISVDGVDHVLEAGDVTVVRRATGGYVVQESDGYVVALDAEVTPELRAEGLARELISRVQRMRKEAGLAVSDRITLLMDGDADVAAAARAHTEYVARETLASSILVGTRRGTTAPSDHTLTQTLDFDGRSLVVTLSKDS